MLLTCDEHCIGRVVEDVRFQIVSNQISGNHCKIYRKKVPPAEEDVEHPSKVHIFLKDTRLYIFCWVYLGYGYWHSQILL